jgi:predicted NBD/HSP70 family sugar kinase
MTSRYGGVDVGGTKLSAAVGGGPTQSASTPRTVAGLVDTIAHLLPPGLTRVVVGLPGTTTPEVVRWVPNLRFLDGVPLASTLAERLDTTVMLANDAQLALIGELFDGAARGHRDVLLISVGTGVGGAVLADGRIYRGAHGSAGSFGWLAAPSDTGVSGRLDPAASGAALDSDARALGYPDARAVVEAAARGKPDAAAAVGGITARLGAGIGALSSVFDPQLLLIGGGLGIGLKPFLDVIRRAHQQTASPDGRRARVELAALGPDAGTIGALRAAEHAQEVL